MDRKDRPPNYAKLRKIGIVAGDSTDASTRRGVTRSKLLVPHPLPPVLRMTPGRSTLAYAHPVLRAGKMCRRANAVFDADELEARILWHRRRVFAECPVDQRWWEPGEEDDT